MWLMKRGGEKCSAEHLVLRRDEKTLSAISCLGRKVMEDFLFFPFSLTTFFILKSESSL
jgi:hypothetical protein